MSLYVPLMIGTKVSHNSRIPISEDNPALGVHANGNGNMSLAMSSIGPDNHDPVPKTATE